MLYLRISKYFSRTEIFRLFWKKGKGHNMKRSEPHYNPFLLLQVFFFPFYFLGVPLHKEWAHSLCTECDKEVSIRDFCQKFKETFVKCNVFSISQTSPENNLHSS